MKLVFAGTPEFAAVALRALIAAGHEVALVLTQPDRPGGRGLKLQASPVKQVAQQHGIAVAQPRGLRLDGKFPDDARASQAALHAAQADAMVVAAYGLILPTWVLQAPRHGCFNIHASLLPRWRGAAPIHRAVEAGDAQTGVTIMQMDAGLDTGDMLLRQSVAIGDADTTGTLHDTLAQRGAELMLQALVRLQQGSLTRTPQAAEGVSYAAKVEKHEAVMDWSHSAQDIVRRVRAFNPQPGTSTLLDGVALKIWAARVGEALAPGFHVYGEIMAIAPDGIAVAAMDSIVVLTELQRAGGKRLPVADFLRGCALRVGQQLG
ncbi:MAG: methionyl-tRNA formyltransferase [Comamonadaceae bacterium CG1_02_60_18]|nr:MAG: methionyl-tRNA formyltransferase [Comamonadaceae bacterium CG1_02_60_18]PIQ53010.1 MAG: methionyl-tRNA formyltransferase [Comamonadaceae bacterium CG12_big_fil_rev_8_21_14_0_65_59_15]